jgi:hypothetical protein
MANGSLCGSGHDHHLLALFDAVATCQRGTAGSVCPIPFDERLITGFDRHGSWWRGA